MDVRTLFLILSCRLLSGSTPPPSAAPLAAPAIPATARLAVHYHLDRPRRHQHRSAIRLGG